MHGINGNLNLHAFLDNEAVETEVFTAFSIDSFELNYVVKYTGKR